MFKKSIARMQNLLTKEDPEYVPTNLHDIIYLKEKKGPKVYNKKAQDIVELLLYAAELTDTLPKESVGVKKQKSWPKELEIPPDEEVSDQSKGKLLRLNQQLTDHAALIAEQKGEIDSLKKQVTESNKAIEDIKKMLQSMGDGNDKPAQNTSSPVRNRPPLIFDDTNADTINSTVIARLDRSNLMNNHGPGNKEDTIDAEGGMLEQDSTHVEPSDNDAAATDDDSEDSRTTPLEQPNHAAQDMMSQSMNHNNKQPTEHGLCKDAIAKALHGYSHNKSTTASEQTEATSIKRTINNSLAQAGPSAEKEAEDLIIGRTINNSQVVKPVTSASENPTLVHTYQDALTNNAGPWNTPRPKRSHHNKKPPSKTLKGQKKVKTWTVYVNNIWVETEYIPNDITNRLKSYCNKAGIQIFYTELVPNKWRDDIVGCKVTVPKHQANTVKSEGFWPDYITCRDWSFNPEPDNQFKGRRLWDKVDEENTRCAQGYTTQGDDYRNWRR
jgi:hypothetical protein